MRSLVGRHEDRTVVEIEEESRIVKRSESCGFLLRRTHATKNNSGAFIHCEGPELKYTIMRDHVGSKG